MTGLYRLPTTARIGGKEYGIWADFRDILEIFGVLDDPELPEAFRWRIALALFYKEPLPAEHRQEGIKFLKEFLEYGSAPAAPGPRLMDWEQDAQAIIADVNRVAGQEIRALPFVHWWTFLSWFHAIGQGQLSSLVSIRDKLHRGQSLEQWEQDFYRQNKDRITLKKRYTPEELQEQERLRKMLDNG